MLTKQQKKEFWEHGFVRIPQAVERSEVTKIADFLWLKLEASGILRNQPNTWRQAKPKKIQSISKTALFDALFINAAQARLDELLGENCWDVPEHWGQLLLALPTDQQWYVPNKSWHLDMPQNSVDLNSPGAQVFICIEDVTTQCGATVVATGSHKLVGQWFKENGVPQKSGSSVVQAQLAQEHEWFRELRSKTRADNRDDYLLKPSDVADGVQLQVEELTGKQGDMILMHPFLLHAAAPNIGPNLRLVLTQRVYSLGSS